MVTRELLEVSIEGLGPNHQTSIFPCGIFQVMSGVNKEEGTPNHDLFRLALKSTSLRLYPNYANCDVSMQAEAQQKDIQIRQKVLDRLSAQDKLRLGEILKQKPYLQEILGIEVED